MTAFSGRSPVRVAAEPALALCALALLGLLACGGEGTVVEEREPEAGMLMPSARAYSIDDLKAAGYKLSKTYNVTDLPHAQAAYFGFWGPDPYKRSEFEVRFYADHDTAVRHGQDLARERVGKGARLTEETATWKVGVVDARECHGIRGQSQHAASCTQPVYFDYMIVGNMIMLCPGDELELARKSCETFLEQIK